MEGAIPTTIDLENPGTNGEKIYGPQSYAGIGLSVGSAGDFNNDGIEDFLFTGSVSDAVNLGRGVIYLVFGKVGGIGPINLASLAPSQGFAIYGPGAFPGADDGVDMVAAGAGDVNGDGYGDLIIGAPRNNLDGHWNGRAYIVYGNAAGTGPANLGSMLAYQGSTITIAPNPDSYFGPNLGTSVAGVGDVNNDGYDDVLIGAGSSHNGVGANTGSAYLLYGSASGIRNSYVSTMSIEFGYKLMGTQAGGFAGLEVAGLGDINGDGIDDFAVGMPFANSWEGAVVVRFGIAGGSFSGGLAPTAAQGFIIEGTSYSGGQIAGAGDINADGYEDIILSNRIGGTDNAYVLWGKAGGFGTIDLASLTASQGFRIDQGTDFRTLVDVSAAGDVNGDGFDDFAVGMEGGDYVGGNVYVIYGSATLSSVTLGVTDGRFLTSAETWSRVGTALGSADLNRDGFSEVLVGAPTSRLAGDGTGGVYLTYGDVPTGPVTRTGTVASQTLAGGNFDDTLSGLGGDDDLYGNGGIDTLLGGAGNDRLDGGSGADILTGGTGDDTYFVDAPGDTITETVGQGYDTVFATLSWTLSAGQEIEELAARDARAASALDFSGNEFANRVIGNAGNNSLTGAGGNDVLEGLDGDDILNGGPGNDTLKGGNGDDTAYVTGGTTSADTGTDVVDLGYGSPDGSPTGGDYGLDHLIVDYSTITQNVIFHGPTQPDIGPSFGSTGAEALAEIGGVQRLHFSGVGLLTLTTGSGNDRVYGVSTTDVLSTGAGNDEIYAFYPGLFINQYARIDGGPGTDVVYTVNWQDLTTAVVLDLNNPAGVTIGSGATQRYLRNIEQLYGFTTGSGDDVITLRTDGTLRNVIYTEGGSDTVTIYGNTTHLTTGSAEIDFGYGGSDHLVANFGAATEQVVFRADGDYSNTSIGGVQLQNYVSAEIVTLTTGSGDDVADGRSAMFGTTVDFSAGAGADTLYGGFGDDRLNGDAGQDWLQGGSGGDTESGGTGHDSVWGGTGDDVLAGGDGDDTLIGNDGIDTVSYAAATGAVTVDLSMLDVQDTHGAGWDTLFQVENLIGSAFGDKLTGNFAANSLTGGLGADELAGGADNDRFVYAALADSTAAAADLVTDFEAGKDKLDLSAIDANAGTAGDQAFHLGPTAGHAGDVVLAYDAGTGRTSVSLYVDSDASADAVIWLAGNHLGLGATDFVL